MSIDTYTSGFGFFDYNGRTYSATSNFSNSSSKDETIQSVIHPVFLHLDQSLISPNLIVSSQNNDPSSIPNYLGFLAFHEPEQVESDEDSIPETNRDDDSTMDLTDISTDGSKKTPSPALPEGIELETAVENPPVIEQDEDFLELVRAVSSRSGEPSHSFTESEIDHFFNPAVEEAPIPENPLFPPQTTLKIRDRIYKGEVVNRLPNGQGEVTLPNGDYAVGLFKNGHLEFGSVKSTRVDGSVYRGEVIDKQPAGLGFWRKDPDDINSDYQMGEWHEGHLFSGDAQITMEDGCRFIGKCDCGVYTGKFYSIDGTVKTENESENGNANANVHGTCGQP